MDDKSLVAFQGQDATHDNEPMYVVQLPIIAQRLEEIGADFSERINQACSLPVSEDTVRDIMKIRADITKEFRNLEEKRGGIKDAIMLPYEEFNMLYRQHITDVYRAGDARLKTAIDNVHRKLKQQKTDALLSWCYEYIATFENIPDISGLMHIWMPTVNLTTSDKKLREAGKVNIDRIVSDLSIMKGMDNSVEAEWWNNGCNLAKAISTVNDRKRMVAEIERRKAETAHSDGNSRSDVARTEVATEQTQKIYMSVFRVSGTKEQLVDLRDFMNKNKIKYERAE